MHTDLTYEEARATVARRAPFCLDPDRTTLLLVDDSIVERAVVTSALDHLKWPASLLHARDGREAWAVLENVEAPVIVVTDYEMPRSNGLELVRRIRRDPRTVTIPTFVMSSNPTQDRVHACMAAGATGFFPKPGDADQTMVMVKALHAFAFQHCFTKPPR